VCTLAHSSNVTKRCWLDCCRDVISRVCNPPWYSQTLSWEITRRRRMRETATRCYVLLHDTINATLYKTNHRKPISKRLAHALVVSNRCSDVQIQFKASRDLHAKHNVKFFLDPSLLFAQFDVKLNPEQGDSATRVDVQHPNREMRERKWPECTSEFKG